MKKMYHYIFYCFYSILRKKDSEKAEGATSLITILLVSVIFSLYFLTHVWFNLKFYYPIFEIITIVLVCLMIWILNRRYFMSKGFANQAVKSNENKNKVFCKFFGIFLTVGQLAMFIASGIIASKHVWGW